MSILPPIAFLIFLILAFLLGLGGKKMAPQEPSEKESETSYAGGEDIPGEQRYPGYNAFFLLALFFTVLHVMALIVGLLPKGSVLPGLLYAGLISFALLAVALK